MITQQKSNVIPQYFYLVFQGLEMGYNGFRKKSYVFILHWLISVLENKTKLLRKLYIFAVHATFNGMKSFI